MLGHGLARQCVRVPRPHVVVREREVRAPALHGERRGQVLQCDHAALDVPPGAALTQRGAVPERLTLPLDAPQQRVQRIPLARAFGITPVIREQRQHPLPVQATRGADHPRVGVVGAQPPGGVDVEVDVPRGLRAPVLSGALRDAVREPALHEAFDGGHDPLDRLGGPHVVIGGQHVQGRHVRAEQFRLILGELAPVHAGVVRPLEQGVVHIGDVLDVVHVEAGVPPHPVEQVEGHVRRGVAHVRGVVRGDPAHVQPRPSITRFQPFELPRARVVHEGCGRGPGQLRNRTAGPTLHVHLRLDDSWTPWSATGAPGPLFPGRRERARHRPVIGSGQALMRPVPSSTNSAAPNRMRYHTNRL